jgi:PKD repeat protein
MIKALGKTLAVLMLTLMVGVMATYASGKMQVKIGERVDLFADTQNPSATLKWIVKQGTDILSTQTTRNFTFQFPTQGEYSVNLTATSGKDVESTTVDVLAGDLYSNTTTQEGGEAGATGSAGNGTPLRITLETLPPETPEKTIHLLGDSGKVSFNLDKSTGDILEYRIDRNIFLDSDGNGVADDDIDNANDNSYLNGQTWQTEYKSGESPKIVAEITLVDKSGRKAKEQVQIVFDPVDNTGDPVAVLDVSPAPDPQDNLVHLYNDPQKVTFYSRNSKGKILEYRIDKDVSKDSDGNGNPADDIDNLKDPSFKTGDVWETDYAKSDFPASGQIIAQLTVVGEGGKGSLVQKGLVFGAKPIPPGASLADQGGVRLTADKDFVVKGDPITFTVLGLAQAPDQYTFGWDFNGDGKAEQETEGVNTVQNIYDAAGVYTVKVHITDKQGNTADKDLEIVVKDTIVTKADFSSETNGNTVQFKDLSTAAIALSDKTLTYQWSFGDTDPAGYESQRSQIGLSAPVYTYSKAGKYIVTLTVTDTDKVTDSKSAEVEIAQDLAAPAEVAPAQGTAPATPTAPAAAGGGSFVLKIVKGVLYLILIIIALLILAIGTTLAVFKAKNPSLTFEELVDELKNKILSLIGAHDFDGQEAPEALPKMPTSPLRPRASEEKPVSNPSVPAPAETPAWAKNKDIIEGEVEEDKKGDSDKTPPPPVNEQGPTPDWLKNVK